MSFTKGKEPPPEYVRHLTGFISGKLRTNIYRINRTEQTEPSRPFSASLPARSREALDGSKRSPRGRVSRPPMCPGCPSSVPHIPALGSSEAAIGQGKTGCLQTARPPAHRAGNNQSILAEAAPGREPAPSSVPRRPGQPPPRTADPPGPAHTNQLPRRTHSAPARRAPAPPPLRSSLAVPLCA